MQCPPPLRRTRPRSKLEKWSVLKDSARQLRQHLLIARWAPIFSRRLITVALKRNAANYSRKPPRARIARRPSGALFRPQFAPGRIRGRFDPDKTAFGAISQPRHVLRARGTDFSQRGEFFLPTPEKSISGAEYISPDNEENRPLNFALHFYRTSPVTP